MEKSLYADVILPLAVSECFSYLVPNELEEQAAVGVSVVVPLGRNKYYSGIIYKLHREQPAYKNIKKISSVSSSGPVISGLQIKFWEWLAEYYMCSLGEVMKAAIPAALKASGYSKEISERYTTKKETFVTLSPFIDSEEKLNEALDSLKRAKTQYAALLNIADLLSPVDYNASGDINKNKLSFSHTIIKALESKGFIRLFDKETDRQYDASRESSDKLPQLTDIQSNALASIKSLIEKGKPTLLHGITGSGKTEIYIHLISEKLAKGKDVLYLLPEISITTQLTERLRGYFGNSVIAYHSGLNENTRAECYLRLLKGDRAPLLVLGVRSSLLLPFNNLGLVVVDEEHENTYKQQDPAPRYHARDAAIMLANMSSADILLGSATPSVETYFNAVTGKYGLVTLTERYGGVSLPRVVISDTVRAAKRGEKTSHFNHLLIDRMDKALKENKQVILFQNRRGFSPYVECAECFTVPSCINCNVSLTYHKNNNSLVCHYCGYTLPMPDRCPTCGRADLKTRGFGTEKAEEELQNIFPDAAIARLDLDAITSARSYTRIISNFESGKTDILIGTQMVSKGFDFENLSLVGILNADNMLNYPDFRASERSFQLMMQVAGRAGRRDVQGEVIIQTSQPRNPVIRQVLEGDYEAMFRGQIAERRQFLYPPFCRLIKFTFRHTDNNILKSAVKDFELSMRHIFGKRLLGPETPAVDKVRGEFLCGFLLKIEKERSAAAAKKLVSGVLETLTRKAGYSSLTINVDVDPQ